MHRITIKEFYADPKWQNGKIPFILTGAMSHTASKDSGSNSTQAQWNMEYFGLQKLSANFGGSVGNDKI